MQRYLLKLTPMVLLSFIFLPVTATAAQYYVATSGQDSNPGTQSAPFRTIKHGVSILKPGDTLLIRGGTYRESLRHGYDVIPSGTSWNSPITISAYGEETVTMKPDGGGTVVGLSGGQQYIILKNLIFDAINGTNDGVGVNSGSKFIRFVGCEFKNARKNGVLVSDGGAKIPATHIEFINIMVHHNNRGGTGHGMYISTSNNLVDGSEIYQNGGYGIHVYNGSGRADYNTVRNNKIYGNGTNSDAGYKPAGLVLTAGTGNVAYNNIIWNNPDGISVSWQNPIDTLLYNNTIYNNQGHGIVLTYATNTLVANNIVYGNGVDIANNNSSTTFLNNLTTDPQFVDTTSADFSLRASSPAIDAGTDLSNNDTDFFGHPRPQGPYPDIGAIEYSQASKPTPPRELRAILE